MPTGLVTWSVPPSLDSIAEPEQSRAPGVGSPDPVVADHQPNDRVPRVELDVHHGRVGMFGGVGHRFRHHVIRRDLDRLGQPPINVDIELDR
ncbi:MAG: hypothetical protein QOG65_3497 [Actinomycetota bacterium]|nr:hypothetical protein [Actinomycetota bacterium]